MGKLQRGLSLGATETITNTKLHNLVDNGSLSNIVNADIDNAAAIEDIKLDNIETAGKVSGKSMFNLASIPSGAGVIPLENTSLVSIPNSSLLELTNASLVGGSSFFNLSSIVSLAGDIPVGNLTNSLFSSILNYGTSGTTGSEVSQSSLKLAKGTRSVSGNSSATVTNLPFTSAASFVVVGSFCSNQSATEAVEIVKNSGSQITIYSKDNLAQTVGWIAIGT
jgi:hypothetical protein